MKKVIRFSNSATAYSDVMCLQLAKAIVKELQEDKDLDIEFSFSNELFLNCVRAEIYKTDKKLVNKVKWLVEDVEVHFDNNLRSNDVWDYLPCIFDKTLDDLFMN